MIDEFEKNKGKRFDEIFDFSIIDGYDVTAIHMPYVNHDDLLIENTAAKDVLEKVCELANVVGEKENKNIVVAVHTKTDIDTLIAIGVVDSVKETAINVLKNNKRVIVAIENSPNTSVNFDSGKFAFNGSCVIKNNKYSFANVDLAKYINHERCGCVLDTCHALMTERIMSLLHGLINVGDDVVDSLFKEAKDYVKLVHLCNSKDFGYGEGHGTPFSTDDKESMINLRWFMMLYKKYNYDVPVTLEIREKEFLNPLGFKESFETLKK